MYGPGLSINDMNLGIFYMLAVSSLATYGILLAGWSANSKYAFLGSLRSTAQLISYELVLSSAILIVIMLTGSLNLTVVTESQRAVWFILPLLPIFLIFFIGSIAETNRAPFDLAEANTKISTVLASDYITAKFILYTMFILINFFIYYILLNYILCFYGNTFHTKSTQDTIRPGYFKANTRKYYSTNSNNKPSLHPLWITGFTDGEGSFGIKIYKAKGYALGWRIQPFFQIKLNARDLDILDRIKEFFGGAGTISFEKNSAKLVIIKLSDIIEKVIPHFEAYPLLTKKYADFELFRQIILILIQESPLSNQGFINVLNLRFNLNKGISEELKGLYPNLVPVPRPVVPAGVIHPEWLVGFVDGEGSFNVITVEKMSNAASTLSISYKVWLHFQITQHSRDTLLMERIVTYLGCGSVKKRNNDAVDFKLNKFELLNNIIIPFFLKNPLQSAKILDFQSFIEAARIIESKPSRQWTTEQFNKIKNIQSIMNKYTKENSVVDNKGEAGKYK